MGEDLHWEISNPAGVYSVGNITGFLVAAPFILFAGLLVASQIVHALGLASPRVPSSVKVHGAPSAGALGVGTTLIAAAVLTAFSTLAYRHVTNRFALDYVPLLIVASSIGAWQLHRTHRGRRIHGTLVNLLIILTVLATLLFGILLGASRP